MVKVGSLREALFLESLCRFFFGGGGPAMPGAAVLDVAFSGTLPGAAV